MGLFSFLFGKKKKTKTAPVTAQAPIAEKKEEPKATPTTQKAEAAPKATPAVSKEAKLTPPATPVANEVKSAPKAPKTESKPKTAPAEPKSAQKAQVKPALQKKAEIEEKKQEAAVADTPKKAAKVGKFEIKKTKDERFVFNLYASNHVIVATSQIYSTSSAAINGINSIIKNAPVAPIEDQTLKDYVTLPYPKWEIYRDNAGQYRFRLNATNGSCIVHSQGYTAKTNCKNGIDSIIKTAKDADVIKTYLKKD